ncbi:MAG: hypothetical protein ACRYGK_07825, partial [Janthinobacterium lividum]
MYPHEIKPYAAVAATCTNHDLIETDLQNQVANQLEDEQGNSLVDERPQRFMAGKPGTCVKRKIV